MPALSRRERALIGLGLATVLAAGVYLQLVEPWRAGQRQTAELIPTREATLEKRRALVAQRDRLQSELDAVTREITEASASLLPGPTAPLAASDLQRLMKQMATSAQVDIRSERVLAPLDLSGVLEIPIELTVAGSIRQVVALLARLEGTPRLLTVKDVKLRVAAPGQPRELLTTLVVAGYLRPGESAARPEPTVGRDST